MSLEYWILKDVEKNKVNKDENKYTTKRSRQIWFTYKVYRGHLVLCLQDNIIYNRLYCKIGANTSFIT